jgi:hypothetical protein
MTPRASRTKEAGKLRTWKRRAIGPSPGDPSYQFGQVMRSDFMTLSAVALSSVAVDTEQRKRLVLETFGLATLVRHFRHTRAAPGSPEDQHDDLAAVFGKARGLTFDAGLLYVRRDSADGQVAGLIDAFGRDLSERLLAQAIEECNTSRPDIGHVAV